MTGHAARVFPGVSIDTRTLAPGELFVAIVGDRFDGAEFVGAALEAGAGGIVVPRGRGGQAGRRATGGVVVEVDDTPAALQTLAQAVRGRSGTKGVALTRSAGK